MAGCKLPLWVPELVGGEGDPSWGKMCSCCFNLDGGKHFSVTILESIVVLYRTNGRDITGRNQSHEWLEESGFGGLALVPHHHVLRSLYGRRRSVSNNALRNGFSKLGIVCIKIVCWSLNTSENRVVKIMLSINGQFFFTFLWASRSWQIDHQQWR